ncbi:hypothetical protein H5410_033707 [Solanum commersonii]|uniref:Uncharacterized protein n=1 Tax=Solanum commersonii TaxID=4109 RepID=A0A9J5YPF1_SOLCO|nr:hypothetical protein H5410_033707 [Solanum commersonii]
MYCNIKLAPPVICTCCPLASIVLSPVMISSWLSLMTIFCHLYHQSYGDQIQEHNLLASGDF